MAIAAVHPWPPRVQRGRAMIARLRRALEAMPMRRTAQRIRALDLRLRELEAEHHRLSSRVATLTTHAGRGGALLTAVERPDPDPSAEAAWGSAIALYEHRIAALERRRFRRAS